MRFELDGDVSIEVDGDTEITLPKWMTWLPKHEVESAREFPGSIVACGYNGHDIYILTGGWRLMKIHPRDDGFPAGECKPIDGGGRVLWPSFTGEYNRAYTCMGEELIVKARPLNIRIADGPTYPREDQARNTAAVGEGGGRP